MKQKSSSVRYCDFCKTYHNVDYFKTRRLNTAYVEDEKNFIYSCENEYTIAYNHYEEMWQDYYGGR